MLGNLTAPREGDLCTLPLFWTPGCYSHQDSSYPSWWFQHPHSRFTQHTGLSCHGLFSSNDSVLHSALVTYARDQSYPRNCHCGSISQKPNLSIWFSDLHLLFSQLPAPVILQPFKTSTLSADPTAFLLFVFGYTVNPSCPHLTLKFHGASMKQLFFFFFNKHSRFLCCYFYHICLAILTMFLVNGKCWPSIRITWGSF